MTNLIYQGKINRQFWGKLIRQSTIRLIKVPFKIKRADWRVWGENRFFLFLYCHYLHSPRYL